MGLANLLLEKQKGLVALSNVTNFQFIERYRLLGFHGIGKFAIRKAKRTCFFLFLIRAKRTCCTE
jgi:hypothetical protein